MPQDDARQREASERANAAAEALGIDLSLIEYNLTVTPAQRLKQLQDQLDFYAAVRRAQGLDAEQP